MTLPKNWKQLLNNSSTVNCYNTLVSRLPIKFTSVLYNVNTFNQQQGQDDLLPSDTVAVRLLVPFCTVKTNEQIIWISHNNTNIQRHCKVHVNIMITAGKYSIVLSLTFFIAFASVYIILTWFCRMIAWNSPLLL